MTILYIIRNIMTICEWITKSC